MNDAQIKPLNEAQVNQLIIAGIQMIARFAAMRALEKNGKSIDGDKFNQIMESFKSLSIVYTAFSTS